MLTSTYLSMNILAIVIVTAIVAALLTFVTLANYRDRKKMLPPGTTNKKAIEQRLRKNSRHRAH